MPSRSHSSTPDSDTVASAEKPRDYDAYTVLIRNDPMLRLMHGRSCLLTYIGVVVCFYGPMLLAAWGDGTLLRGKVKHSFLWNTAGLASWLVLVPAGFILIKRFYESAQAYLQETRGNLKESRRNARAFAGSWIMRSWWLPCIALIFSLAVMVPTNQFVTDRFTEGHVSIWHVKPHGGWSLPMYVYVVSASIFVAELCMCVLKCWSLMFYMRRLYNRAGRNVIRPSHPDGIWGLEGMANVFLPVYKLALVVGLILLSMIVENILRGEDKQGLVPPMLLLGVAVYCVTASGTVLGPSLITGVRRLILEEKAKYVSQLRAEYQELLLSALQTTEDRDDLCTRLKATDELLGAMKKAPTWAVQPTMIRRIAKLHGPMAVVLPFGVRFLSLYRAEIGAFFAAIFDVGT